MATILPFKGIIPKKNLADKIVIRSADNYSLDEVKQIIQNNPLSYLGVIYPDYIDNKKTPPNSIERFEKIYKRIKFLQQKNYILQDTQPVYYVYKQKHPLFEFNGIIAAISVDDYLNGIIKIHEQTLSDRELKLKEYLKYCKVNAEPVVFFYEKNKNLQDLVLSVQSQTPEIQIQIDNVNHILWKSIDIKMNDTFRQHFAEMDAVYIGDGHHRSASSVMLAKELRKNNLSNKSINYFLGAFFQEDNLKIYSFHRLLKNISIPENFLQKISEKFEVTEINTIEYKLCTHVLGMYWNKKRYLLKYKTVDNESKLDTEILFEYILKDVFLINDIRNNSHVDYIPEYTCSISQATLLVDEGKYQMAFFTYPVSIEVIKKTALQRQTMPPKSTYILPKLLNALVIYSLENSM